MEQSPFRQANSLMQRKISI